MKLVVFISGSGTNLQALIDNCRREDYPARIVAVVSNNPQAYGLVRADQAGIPTVIVPHQGFRNRREHETEILRRLRPFEPELCVLAGYMRVVTPLLIDSFYNREKDLPGVVNIHPADTRQYQGAHGYEFALGLLEGSRRLEKTYITVHFVDPGVDTGPIILQAPVEVHADDTIDSLRQRGLEVEHRLYPQAVRLIAEGKVRLVDGRVHILA